MISGADAGAQASVPAALLRLGAVQNFCYLRYGCHPGFQEDALDKSQRKFSSVGGAVTEKSFLLLMIYSGN